ncbi:MAG: TetR/AcrR family transcriptional regulator [Cyclobacteriaceae bacterium]
MREIKEKIVASADELFMRLGVRSVTMEDVAREVSISKKTIYQFFDNKEHLVKEVVQNHLDAEAIEFSSIAAHAANAIHEIFQISGCIRKNLKSINPTTLHDLRKYYPTAFQLFTEFKTQFIRGNIEDNLKRGIKEGYYRQEIDPLVIATFRMEQVEHMFDGRLFPSDQFEFTHVQMQLFEHFVFGLVTESGRKLYMNFKTEEEIN